MTASIWSGESEPPITEQVVENVAALRALRADFSTVLTRGQVTASDGAGAFYRLDLSGAPAVDDGLNTIVGGTGKVWRIFLVLGNDPNIVFPDPTVDTVTNIAALRLFAGGGTVVHTKGYTSAGDGGHGSYRYDSSDTTTADNGGSVIVGVGNKRWKLIPDRDGVRLKQFGADSTGATLCNTALNAAKAVCGTIFLGTGTFKVENYTLQDVRLIGSRASGSNTGANEQTIIEGSGDIFVGANNFVLEHMVIRNTSAGARGKHITVANIDTKIGPIIDVEFRKATHHIYAADTTKAIVDGTLRDCRFSDASVFSRYFQHGLFRYSEFGCYTQNNQKGLSIFSCSTALFADSVFELHNDGAVYVENAVTVVDAVRGLRFQNCHFEANGDVTPTADVTINVTPSRARISFIDCGFYLPTVANPINLSSSPLLRVLVENCTAISFANQHANSVVTEIHPVIPGEVAGLYSGNGALATNSYVRAYGGFRSLQGLTTTIGNTDTPTGVPVPDNYAVLVLVKDTTTTGSALLLVHGTSVTVVSSTIATVTFSVISNFLHGRTTGGASSRVMFFNFITT